MALALVAFAIVTYIATDSIATTAIRTLVCAVLIQLGYFLALVYLAARTAKERRDNPDLGLHGKSESEKPKVPLSINEPGHPNF